MGSDSDSEIVQHRNYSNDEMLIQQLMSFISFALKKTLAD